MAQLQTTEIFNDGETVTGARLNNIIGAASALIGIINDQGPATPLPLGGDEDVLLVDAGALRKANVSDLPRGVTNVAFTMVSPFAVSNPDPNGPLVGIAVTIPNQSANTVYAAPAAAGGAPAFRRLAPKDTIIAPVVITAANIDCSLGNVFTKVMGGNHTFSFSNFADGQTIKVYLQQPGVSPNWTADWYGGTFQMYWRNRDTPILSTGPGARDIFTFTRIGNLVIYGYADQDFGA